MRHDADETAETTDIRISCMVVHGEVGRAGLTEGDRRQSEPAATSSSSSSNVACRAQRGLSPLQAHRPGGQPAGRCALSRYQVLRQSNQQSVPCPARCRAAGPGHGDSTASAGSTPSTAISTCSVHVARLIYEPTCCEMCYKHFARQKQSEAGNVTIPS